MSNLSTDAVVISIGASLIGMAASSADWRRRPSPTTATFALMMAIVGMLNINKLIMGVAFPLSVIVAESMITSAIALTIATRMAFGVVIPLGVANMREAGTVFGGMIVALVASTSLLRASLDLDRSLSASSLAALIISLVIAYDGSRKTRVPFAVIAAITAGLLINAQYHLYSTKITDVDSYASDIGFVLLAFLGCFASPPMTKTGSTLTGLFKNRFRF